jgi:hypothetical protein
VLVDYDWLLAIGDLAIGPVAGPLGIHFGVPKLAADGVRHGYRPSSVAASMRWALSRIALHSGVRSADEVRSDHIAELLTACRVPINVGLCSSPAGRARAVGRYAGTGTKVRYLFLRRGRPMSAFYLFNYSLRDACKAAGLVDADGRATVTAHRFRHTVGTQLAERGAKLHTIMSVLGHESPHMSMIYARISDAEVLRDYRSVLEPGAVIAGAGAKAIRAGVLSAVAVDWLRSNFLKTELELGHCLRLPSEGPCECDLYLSCARFVTTPAYAPRLRERHRLELSLADDARNRAWLRDVERHCGIARRIEQLLSDLGEEVE